MIDCFRSLKCSMAELLSKNGFEVIACDDKTPGCFDLDRSSLLDALKRLEERAAGADLALVFFAGHGMAAGEVNILGRVDAGVDCNTSGVTNVVPVEGILAATGPARHKLVILDACRNNQLSDICPNLKSKRLSCTSGLPAGHLDAVRANRPRRASGRRTVSKDTPHLIAKFLRLRKGSSDGLDVIRMQVLP